MLPNFYEQLSLLRNVIILLRLAFVGMFLLITDRDIEKAARYLLREHGERAVGHAERHADSLRLDGLDDTAEAWQRVAQRLGADPPLD